MDSVDKFFQESYYNIIRAQLSFIGVWPFDSVTKRYTICFGFLLLLASGVTFEVLGMIDVRTNTFEVIDCLPSLVLSVLTTSKVICLACALPKIKYLLIEMEKYWCSLKSDGETKILHSYAIYGRKFGFAYTESVVLLGHSVLFLSATLLSKFIRIKSNEGSNDSTNSVGAQAGVPYRVNYLVDLDTYYAPIFIHTAMCEATYVFFLVVVDVLYMTFVQHCCGLLEALRYVLENSCEFEGNVDGMISTLKHPSRDSRIYSIVSYSIRRHSEAIQFIDSLESLFRLPLFIHMGCVISIITTVGIQVIINTANISRVLQHSVYFSGAIINAFFENWQGQKIIDYSEKVYESAYNAQWYKMPIAARKLLIMIMLRSIKPSQVTAGKIIVMSYVNFNAVIRLSSSYFMLLKSMQ
ncbi:uncharacterized protein LOC116851311 [Odontomachus brunneus]|uniref:uncharacterized protein LOC116851311 n=1 Tax=Odontomachus brunneus TaxID=486640 RepID=UPI0013F21FD6|nr:uncharacterized protein LOC116851311 [Odontomachus brunneus]